METKQLLPGLGLALLAFLIGEKSVVVGKLAIVGWDSVVADSSLKRYLIQGGFLALAVGLSAATLTAIATDAQKRDQSAKIIIAAIIGSIGGLLEILETMAFEQEAAHLGQRPVFFFCVFVLIFLAPPMAAVVSDKNVDIARDRLARIAAAILMGFLVSLPISGMIDFSIYGLPELFGEKAHWRNAGGDLIFRPLAFVWMGTAWVAAAFSPNASKLTPESSSPSLLWIAFYAFAAAVTAALYAGLFVDNKGTPDFAPLVPITIGFAALGVAPILGFALAGAWRRGLDSVSPVRAAATVFIVTTAAMSLSLASGAGRTLLAFLTASALMGAAGASIVPALYLARRISRPLTRRTAIDEP